MRGSCLSLVALVLVLPAEPVSAGRGGRLEGPVAALRAASKKAGALPETDHHGGFEKLGGFTTVNTTGILVPRVGQDLLSAFREAVPVRRSTKQEAFNIRPNSKEEGPMVDFMKAHNRLVLRSLNARTTRWSWLTSSVMLLSERIQTEFHDHLNADERINPARPVTRQWGVMSLRRMGTVFQSPARDQIYGSLPGETALFNEGSLHMSPEEADLGLFLIHFYSRATASFVSGR